ncbi:MAG: thermonuclease family protein, partial [Actinomycetia bacterium]|nr:thermonuclease family protein [Actinomycetes bacterium]
MSWWTRRRRWQKIVMVAAGLFVVVNTAAALVAPQASDEAISTANTTDAGIDSAVSADITVANPVPTASPTPSSTTFPSETSTTRTPVTTTTVATTPTTLVPSPGTDRVTLASVTDGDTVRVVFASGAIEKVRLIGINTPETGECLAAEATTAITTLLTGQVFTMTSDVNDRDQYNRLLRYIWLDDGTFVNESLVADGFALARDYPPDSGYTDVFATAQDRAENASLGVWASDACGPVSGGDLQITHIEHDAPGNDNENLNGEWAVITNTGSESQAMSGWVLKDESASHRYTFPSNLTLEANSSISVYTGCGTDTSTSLFWCNTGSA